MNEAKLSRSTDNLGWDRPHPEIPTLLTTDTVSLPNGTGVTVPLYLPGKPRLLRVQK